RNRSRSTGMTGHDRRNTQVLLTAAYDNQGRRATLTRGGPTGAGVSSTTYLYHLVSRQQTLAQDLDGPRRGC
ncbi:MAG: hypothetical protein WCH44_15605, partial [Betaproteobacteria bacterium]